MTPENWGPLWKREIPYLETIMFGVQQLILGGEYMLELHPLKTKMFREK